MVQAVHVYAICRQSARYYFRRLSLPRLCMLLAVNLLATTSGDLVYLAFACYLQGTCWLLLQETWSTVCREPASYYFRRLSLPRLWHDE